MTDSAARPTARPAGRRLRTMAAGLSAAALVLGLAACGGGPRPAFTGATYAGDVQPTVATPEVRDIPEETARRAEEERQATLEAQREADAAREAAEAAAAEAEPAPGALDVAAVPPEPVDAEPLAPEPPGTSAAAPPSTVPGTPTTATPEPVAEPTPEPVAPRAEPVAPAPEPVAEPTPVPAPAPEPEPEPEPAPAPEVAETPASPPAPAAEPEADEPALSFGTPAADPAPQPEAAPEPAPTAEAPASEGGLSFGGRERPPRPAVSDEFPSLSTVPERPSDLPTEAQREEIRRELEAGRSQAESIAETGERPPELSEDELAPPEVPEAPPERVEVTEPEAAPAEPAPAPEPATPTGPRLLASVSFPPGATALPAAERGTVSSLAAELADGDGAIRIVGHASAGLTGDATSRRVAANGIALDRANAVANALIAGGVAAERIRVVSAPIDMDADTTDPESRKADIFLDN